MVKVLMAVAFIVTGAILLGWYDLFHLAVGLPLLLGEALLLWGWKEWTQPEEEDEEEEEEGGVGHQLFAGALGGSLSLLLLAGGFSAASRLGLSGLFYGRDCPALLREIAILEEGQAYGRIVQVVEERLQEKTSPTCREELTERKAHALMGWAEQLKGEERIRKLRKAWEAAKDTKNRDLAQSIAARLRVAEQERFIEQQRQENEQQQQENRRLREELEKSGLSLRETGKGEVVVTFSDVLFESGRAELTAAAWDAARKVADILNRDPQGKKVRIEGHTDSTGSEEANQRLSRDRAKSVARTLETYGVGRERLVVWGYGESDPVAPNDTPDGQAKNRRVEIIFQNLDAPGR